MRVVALLLLFATTVASAAPNFDPWLRRSDADVAQIARGRARELIAWPENKPLPPHLSEFLEVLVFAGAAQSKDMKDMEFALSSNSEVWLGAGGISLAVVAVVALKMAVGGLGPYPEAHLAKWIMAMTGFGGLSWFGFYSFRNDIAHRIELSEKARRKTLIMLYSAAAEFQGNSCTQVVDDSR